MSAYLAMQERNRALEEMVLILVFYRRWCRFFFYRRWCLFGFPTGDGAYLVFYRIWCLLLREMVVISAGLFSLFDFSSSPLFPF